jgi:TPR repeat protein
MKTRRRSSSTDTGFLQDLVLWRNDPERAIDVLDHARKGNVHAQYAMGLLYAEGRGVSQDEVQAYVWLTRAIDQGDRDAGDLRRIVVENMTSEQLALAQHVLDPTH